MYCFRLLQKIVKSQCLMTLKKDVGILNTLLVMLLIVIQIKIFINLKQIVMKQKAGQPIFLKGT